MDQTLTQLLQYLFTKELEVTALREELRVLKTQQLQEGDNGKQQ